MHAIIKMNVHFSLCKHLAFSAFLSFHWVAVRASVCKKLNSWAAGMVICLERGADLHMAQLMPLTVSCFSKIQISFAFLLPAHWGSPEKKPVNMGKNFAANHIQLSQMIATPGLMRDYVFAPFQKITMPHPLEHLWNCSGN